MAILLNIPYAFEQFHAVEKVPARAVLSRLTRSPPAVVEPI
jgi:hypothetical protein